MYIHLITHLEDIFITLNDVTEFISSLNKGLPLRNMKPSTNSVFAQQHGYVPLFASLNDTAEAMHLDAILKDRNYKATGRIAYPIIVCYVPTSTNIKIPSWNKRQTIKEFYSTGPTFAETAKLFWVTSPEFILESAKQLGNTVIVDTDTAIKYRLEHTWLTWQKTRKQRP